MKYMGSKRWMLLNGLGTALCSEASKSERFIDLFAGSGAVACHVAKTMSVPVLAYDIQHFSAILTNAIITRRKTLSAENTWKRWELRARKIFETGPPPRSVEITKASVHRFREWSARQLDLPVTRAYGGHYFSPTQAVWIDAFRGAVPASEPEKTVALAALIQATSRCAAAPGHTAQPFQPTKGARDFLQEAWAKDIVVRIRECLISLALQCAKRSGRAEIGDANAAAKHLRHGDLVFVDPPYSGVQYSRFYHVLETVSRGKCGEVSGVGRYPDMRYRPISRYSLRSQSAKALDDLLQTVASNGAKAILTFPDHECSNGLSGELVRDIARNYFRVKEMVVQSKFSTLGGNTRFSKTGNKRTPKKNANELILVLKQK